MRIFKLISIIITISLLIQDIVWASPSLSTLHPKSAIPDQGFIREFIDSYIGRVLTDEDRRRIREFMAEIDDLDVRRTVGEIFGINEDQGLCVTGDTLLPIVSAEEFPNPNFQIPISKSQFPNPKQIPISKSKIPKHRVKADCGCNAG